MTTATSDPVAILQGLSTAQLRQRIVELDAETKAVRVLLRAALARERAATRRPKPVSQEGAPNG